RADEVDGKQQITQDEHPDEVTPFVSAPASPGPPWEPNYVLLQPESVPHVWNDHGGGEDDGEAGDAGVADVGGEGHRADDDQAGGDEAEVPGEAPGDGDAQEDARGEHGVADALVEHHVEGDRGAADQGRCEEGRPPRQDAAAGDHLGGRGGAHAGSMTDGPGWAQPEGPAAPAPAP